MRNSLPIPISLFVRSHEAILFLTEIESRISFDVPVEVAAAGSDLLVDVGLVENVPYIVEKIVEYMLLIQ